MPARPYNTDPCRPVSCDLLDEEFENRNPKYGEMPSILSNEYSFMFSLCRTRARALVRTAQGRPRADDPARIKLTDQWLGDCGLSPREFGFVDPPKLLECDVVPNTGKLFAAPTATLN